MKTLPIVALLLGSAGITFASVPRKIPAGRYQSLVTHSPFTLPPAPEPTRTQAFPDLALIGVSSLGGGQFRITLMDKKAPDAERVYVDSDKPGAKYQIIKVNQVPGNPMATTVILKAGGMTGTVGYDEKLLTVAAKTKVQPANPPPTPPPGVVTPPRPRVQLPQPNGNSGVQPGGNGPSRRQ